MSVVGRMRSLYKHNPLILKLPVSAISVFFLFHLTHYNSTEFPVNPGFPTPRSSSQLSTSPPVVVTSDSESSVVVSADSHSPLEVSEDSKSPLLVSADSGSPELVNVIASDVHRIHDKDDKCDLFRGEWLPNPSGPSYDNETCDFIETHQNCMTGYIYWKWNPRNCELPAFEPRRFLDMMRDKSWALIGDSITRNHVQSLLCMLSKVEKAIEVYHDEEYKSRTWLFPSYNFNISVIWSPYLAEAAIFEDMNGVSSSEVELHLDRLDKKWTDQFMKWDYMIFSTGKWFLKNTTYYENNTVLGCYKCRDKNLTQIGFDITYRKSLQSALDFITSSSHKGVVFFRTFTPDHFEGGEWSDGGYCNRTVPFKEGEVEIKDLNKILRRVELEEIEKAMEKASQNGVNLKLLDMFQLSLLRPDGHPGPYRYYHPLDSSKNTLPNDCLHWCLPGPIDSWNDVIMEMLVDV